MVLVSNTHRSNEFDVIAVFKEALFVAEGYVISEPGRKPTTESIQPESTVKTNSEVQDRYLSNVVIYITIIMGSQHLIVKSRGDYHVSEPRGKGRYNGLLRVLLSAVSEVDSSIPLPGQSCI
jgi:hypothetical protein